MVQVRLPQAKVRDAGCLASGKQERLDTTRLESPEQVLLNPPGLILINKILLTTNIFANGYRASKCRSYLDVYILGFPLAKLNSAHKYYTRMNHT